MDVSTVQCGAGDIDDVVRFIDEQWKRGHILATCRPLLDWQHRNADGYAFVLARRRVDNAVLGVLGYIATARFDPALADDNVLWLTTWKVREDAGVAGLGLQLLQYLSRVVPHRAIGAVFPAEATAPIYRAMGFHVGELQHYVMPANAAPGGRSGGDRPTIRRLSSDDDFASLALTDPDARLPRKTAEYFRRRYARHPLYTYVVAALLDGGMPAGMLAARIAEHRGTRALRIVDFLGAPGLLARSGSAVRSLIDETGGQYADVYNAGIDAEVFAEAGFARVDPDGRLIVPDHFEPYEPRNVRLWFAFKGPGRPVLFKGDSDRDRPNRAPGSADK